jgi:hypothetical protein
MSAAAPAVRRNSLLLVVDPEEFIDLLGAIVSQLPVPHRLRQNGCYADRQPLGRSYESS